MAKPLRSVKRWGSGRLLATPVSAFPAVSALLMDSAMETEKEQVSRDYLAIAKVLRCIPQSHSGVLHTDHAFWEGQAVPVGFRRFQETPGN
jgi:hypothetical protein